MATDATAIDLNKLVIVVRKPRRCLNPVVFILLKVILALDHIERRYLSCCRSSLLLHSHLFAQLYTYSVDLRLLKCYRRTNPALHVRIIDVGSLLISLQQLKLVDFSLMPNHASVLVFYLAELDLDLLRLDLIF